MATGGMAPEPSLGDFDAEAAMEAELAALVRTRTPPLRQIAFINTTFVVGTVLTTFWYFFPSLPPRTFLLPLSNQQDDDDLLSDEESSYSLNATSKPFHLGASGDDDDDDDDDDYQTSDIFAKMNSAWAAREGRLNESVQIGSLHHDGDDEDKEEEGGAISNTISDPLPPVDFDVSDNASDAAAAAMNGGALSGNMSKDGAASSEAEAEADTEGVDSEERMPDVREVVARMQRGKSATTTSNGGSSSNGDSSSSAASAGAAGAEIIIDENPAPRAHAAFLKQYDVQEGERRAKRDAAAAQLTAATQAGTAESAARAAELQRKLESQHAAALAKMEDDAAAERRALEEEQVGLALPGVRWVTWTILAVIDWCLDCRIT
jgi:hypothetical protein